MMRLGIPLIVIAMLLAGCGSKSGVACDEGPYRTAVSQPKVKAPEGLDDLDPLNEIPMPEASPQDPWPADGPCIESPPEIIRME